jgi:hypothetical protein
LGNDVWIIDSLSYLASPLLAKVNYFWRPLANYKIDNENLFDLSINLGVTSRLLTNSIAKKEAVLQTKFGLHNRLLLGLEGGVYFSFNSLTLFFNPILIFGDVDSDDFPGHGIYLLGAIVNGDAFRFRLKRK